MIESRRSVREKLAVGHYLRWGGFREAVEEVRTYWQICVPKVQLPPESDDVLLPPTLEAPGDLSDLRAVWSNHPHLPPIMWGSRRCPDEIKVSPTDWAPTYRGLSLRWQLDLRQSLRLGGVPDEYLTDRPPYYGTPPVSAHQLPWLRFAAACVLYETPGEDFLPFAEYGEVSISGTLTERELREQQTARAVQHVIEVITSRKMWELRLELDGMDCDRAKQEVAQRFFVELMAEQKRMWEEHERETKRNPPRHHYLKVDPEQDTQKDVWKQLSAIRTVEGCTPVRGRPRMDGLTAIQCAILHRDHNPRDPNDKRVKSWSYAKLAARFKEKKVDDARSAKEHVMRGGELLAAWRKNL